MAAEELANRIKVFRAARSISQEELAVAVGVTRKTINTIETGKYVPSTVLALRIARYFGAALRVGELFLRLLPGVGVGRGVARGRFGSGPSRRRTGRGHRPRCSNAFFAWAFPCSAALRHHLTASSSSRATPWPLA